MIDSAYIRIAIQSEDVLAFDYPSSVDGQPQRRVFSPWSLEKDGTVVMGFDHDRDSPRRYTLAKITGEPDVLLSESFVRPAT